VLIDSHCHIMPERLALAIRRYFDEHIGFRKLAYDGVLPSDVVRAQREAGTHRFWALPCAHKAGMAASLNEWMASDIAPIPGAIPAATFHPGDGDLSALVRRAFGALRLRVAKLHCSVGGFDVGDPRLEPIWDAAEVEGAAVVVHVGRHVDGSTAARELEPIDHIARAHPRLHLVIAHAGSPDIDAALDLLERHAAVYADLTSAAEWSCALPVERLEALHERLLFGSDAPNAICKIEEAAAWLGALGLSDGALRAIRGENALRLVPE
jgi:predicted TIM-barrel fold metal-dependent hydrolase